VRGDIAAPSGRSGILIAAHTPASPNRDARAPLSNTIMSVHEFTAGSKTSASIYKLNRDIVGNNSTLKALREQARNGFAAALGVVER